MNCPVEFSAKEIAEFDPVEQAIPWPRTLLEALIIENEVLRTANDRKNLILHSQPYVREASLRFLGDIAEQIHRYKTGIEDERETHRRKPSSY